MAHKQDTPQARQERRISATFSIDPAVLAKLDKAATADSRSRSSLIRWLIDRYLAEQTPEGDRG